MPGAGAMIFHSSSYHPLVGEVPRHYHYNSCVLIIAQVKRQMLKISYIPRWLTEFQEYRGNEKRGRKKRKEGKEVKGVIV